MTDVLVDSSVWIDHFRSRGGRTDSPRPTCAHAPRHGGDPSLSSMRSSALALRDGAQVWTLDRVFEAIAEVADRLDLRLLI